MMTSSFCRETRGCWGGGGLGFWISSKDGRGRRRAGACGRFYPTRPSAASVARKIVIHTSCQLNNPPHLSYIHQLPSRVRVLKCVPRKESRPQGISVPGSHIFRDTGVWKRLNAKTFSKSWKEFFVLISSRESCVSLEICSRTWPLTVWIWFIDEFGRRRRY